MTEPKYNRRKTDQTPWWIRGIMLAVGLVLAILIVTVLAFTNRVKGYESQNHENDLVACESGNISRAGDISNLRGDINRLKATRTADEADVAGLKRSPIQDPVWIKARQDEIHAISLNIAQKRNAIRVKLSSVAEFAIKPGSPIKDCDRAYPQ